MSERLSEIMNAADRLTVDAVAQVPYCVPRDESVADVYRNARREGYDWLPVRDSDGVIRRIVQTSKLEHLSSWNQIPDQASRITVDHLVARDAPILSILSRIENGPLLCLGRNGVDGIVTVYDLNRPAAHYFGFALAIVIEGAVAKAIEEALQQRFPGDTDAAEREAVEAGIDEENIEKWRRARTKSEHLPLVSWLSFGGKLKLLKRVGITVLANLYSAPVSAAQLLGELGEVLQLRNDVAHDKSSLTDHRTMCRRLSLAHELAHKLTSESKP